MRIPLFMLLLFACNIATGQESPTLITGKVMADLSELDGIYIVNVATEASTTTQTGGYFAIPATAGDTLMFSSTLTVAKRIVIKSTDFESDLLFVKLEMLANQLDEVIVKQYRNISPESMGIVPEGQRIFTPAERKLNTASNPYAQFGLGAVASLDPVFNWMSGRTSMLKKEVEIEKKEGWLAVLSNMFDADYIVKLKIPADYVAGFYRYCIENRSLIASLKSGNKTMAGFQLSELAVIYNQIITLESE